MRKFVDYYTVSTNKSHKRENFLGVKLNDTYIPIENYDKIHYYCYPEKSFLKGLGHFNYQIHILKRGELFLKDGTKIDFTDSDKLLFEVKDI